MAFVKLSKRPPGLILIQRLEEERDRLSKEYDLTEEVLSCINQQLASLNGSIKNLKNQIDGEPDEEDEEDEEEDEEDEEEEEQPKKQNRGRGPDLARRKKTGCVTLAKALLIREVYNNRFKEGRDITLEEMGNLFGLSTTSIHKILRQNYPECKTSPMPKEKDKDPTPPAAPRRKRRRSKRALGIKITLAKARKVRGMFDKLKDDNPPMVVYARLAYEFRMGNSTVRRILYDKSFLQEPTSEVPPAPI